MNISIDFQAIHNTLVFHFSTIIDSMILNGYNLMTNFLKSDQTEFILQQGHEVIEILEEELDLCFRKGVENALRKEGVYVNILWKSDNYNEPKLGGSQNQSDPWIVGLYDWCDGGTNFARRLLKLVDEKKGTSLLKAEREVFTCNSSSLLTFAERINGKLSRPMVSIVYSLLYRKTYSHFRETQEVEGSAFLNGKIQSKVTTNKPSVGLIRITIPRYVNYMSKYNGIFEDRFLYYLRRKNIRINCSIASGSSANDLTMLAEGEVEGYIDIRKKFTSLNPNQDACLQEEDVISIKEYLSRKGIYVSKVNGLVPNLQSGFCNYSKKNSISLVALNPSKIKDNELAYIIEAIDFGSYYAMRQYFEDKSNQGWPAAQITIQDFIMFKKSNPTAKSNDLKEIVTQFRDILVKDSKGNFDIMKDAKALLNKCARKNTLRSIANAAIMMSLLGMNSDANEQFISSLTIVRQKMQNLIDQGENSKKMRYKEDYSELMVYKNDLATVTFNYAVHLKRELKLVDPDDFSKIQLLHNKIINLLSEAIENNPIRIDCLVSYADILHRDNQSNRALVYLIIADKLVDEREIQMNLDLPIETKTKLYQLGVSACSSLANDDKKLYFNSKLEVLFIPEIRRIASCFSDIKKGSHLGKDVEKFLGINVRHLTTDILVRLGKLLESLKKDQDKLPEIESNLQLILSAVFGINNWNIEGYLGVGRDKLTLKVTDSVIAKDNAALKILIPSKESKKERERMLKNLSSEQISELSRTNQNLVYTHSPGKFTAPNGEIYYFYLEELFDKNLDKELKNKKYDFVNKNAMKNRLQLFFDIFGQIVNGVKGCHDSNYVYDGLKAENIVIKGDRIALCDFSSMVQIGSKEKSDGSMLTMPVELMNGCPPSFETDMFRVLAEGYNILFGAYPFSEQNVKPKTKRKRMEFNSILKERAHKRNYDFLFNLDYNPYFEFLPDNIRFKIKAFFEAGLKPNLSKRVYKTIDELNKSFKKLRLECQKSI